MKEHELLSRGFISVGIKAVMAYCEYHDMDYPDWLEMNFADLRGHQNDVIPLDAPMINVEHLERALQLRPYHDNIELDNEYAEVIFWIMENVKGKWCSAAPGLWWIEREDEAAFFKLTWA